MATVKKGSSLALNLMKVLAVLMPVLILGFLVKVLLGAKFTGFLPVASDEVAYWHETATFLKAGFNNGYYTFDEIPAVVGFSHYGPHGPFYAMFYAFLALFFGWQFYTAPIINLLIVVLSLALFVYLTKPSMKQLVYLSLFIALCPYIHLLTSTSMITSFHYAAAIILAGLFYVLFEQRAEAPTYIKNGALIFIIFISLFKYSWALLLLPYFILIKEELSLKNFIRAFACSIPIAVLVFVTNSSFTSNVPFGSVWEIVGNFKQSFAEGFKYLWEHSLVNIRGLIHPDQELAINSFSVKYLALLLLYLIFEINGIFQNKLFKKIGSVKKLSSKFDKLTDSVNGERIFHIYNLLPLLLLVLATYTMGWSYYRLLAPLLLLSTLLLLARKKYQFVTFLLIINMLLLPDFLALFKEYRIQNFKAPTFHLEKVRPQIDKALKYEANQDPWCNTVLAYKTTQFTMTIPAGMGSSTIYNSPTTEKIKSKYVLLDKKNFKRFQEGYQHFNRLRLLESMVHADLFLNLDADCPN